MRSKPRLVSFLYLFSLCCVVGEVSNMVGFPKQHRTCVKDLETANGPSLTLYALFGF